MESRNQAFLESISQIIDENLVNEQFGVSELAASMNLSRSQLHRRIKRFSRLSTSRFICIHRLEKAQALLKLNEKSVSEIAFQVGFSSPQYFHKCFTDHFGITPGQFFEQHQLEHDSFNLQITIPGSKTVESNTLDQLGKAKWLITFLLSVILIIGMLYVHSSVQSKEIRTKPRLAILPFKNLSENLSNQYFADGIIDDILDKLATIRDLSVISRTSSDLYKTTTASVGDIAKELKADYLLEGSVRQRGSQIRVVIQLIDALQDEHVWSETYDRQLDDIFKIQSDIANEVANRLKVEITDIEHELIKMIPTSVLTAYDFYLKGNSYFDQYNMRWDETDLEFAISMYQRAIQMDSQYALAYIGLANAYLGGMFYGKNNYGSGSTWIDSACSIAQKALDINPDLFEAYLTLGHAYRAKGLNEEYKANYVYASSIKPNHPASYEALAQIARFERKYDRQLTYAMKSLELDPRNSNRYLHVKNALRNLNLLNLAVEYVHKALEMQPDNIHAYEAMGVLQVELGDFNEALKYFQKMFRLNPNDLWAINHLGRIYGWMGNFNESLKYFDKIQKIMSEPGYQISATTPHAPHYVGYTLWNLGDTLGAKSQFNYQIQRDTKLAESEINLTGSNYHYNLACTKAFLGQKEEAYRHLEKASSSPGVPFNIGWTIHDPLLASIQNEDRFKKKMNDYQKILSKQIRGLEEINFDFTKYIE